MIKYLLTALALMASPVLAQPVYADSFESLVTIDFTNDNKGPIPVTDAKLAANKLTAKCTNLVNGTCMPAATVPPVQPPSNCDVTPAGWTHINTTYEKVFKNYPAWTSPNYLVPVGSFTTKTTGNPSGHVVTGKILTFEGVIGAGNSTITFAGSQPVPAAGYGGGYNPNYAAVSINKCKGDITIPRSGDNTKCVMAVGSLEGRLIFGPNGSNGCKFPQGTKVFTHFWFPNMNDPTNATKNGCSVLNSSQGTKCNVNVRVSSINPPVQPPTVGCNITDPFIKPAGFQGYILPWSSFQKQYIVGQPPKVFPEGASYLTPVGSYTINNQSMRGKWLAFEFVPAANTSYRVTFLGVQRQNEVRDYPAARGADAVFVSVSPCAGDLRAPNRFANDPQLDKCRALGPEPSPRFGTRADEACKLTPGVKHYINVAFVNPIDGLSTTESTCDRNWIASGKCDVNVNAR